MGLTTRYVTRQVLIATFFVACVLVGVVWMTQSLRLVGVLVQHGVTLQTFMTMMVLLIPDLVAVVLPFALVIGLLFIYARLYADSELIALRAVGLSDVRLSTPAFISAGLVVLVLYSINFYFLPASFQKFKDLESQVRGNVTAALVKPGEFMTFEGISVYVRKRYISGKLQGIYIYDARHTPAFTLVAKEGVVMDTAQGARIVLHDGARYERPDPEKAPSLLVFEKYALDIESPHAASGEPRVRKPYERFLSELVRDEGDKGLAGKLWVEVHQRFLMPLMSFAFVGLVMAFFLTGDYSRRGRSRRIIYAVAACALLEIATFIALNLGEKFTFMPYVAEGVVLLVLCGAMGRLLKNDAALFGGMR
ncbi:MAG: hypothetical protein C0514_07135 [Candidatus Puniceispirillum sp.]|nr:hypothetical protein [Candidatus Puniceispirillum sp.]